MAIDPIIVENTNCIFAVRYQRFLKKNNGAIKESIEWMKLASNENSGVAIRELLNMENDPNVVPRGTYIADLKKYASLKNPDAMMQLGLEYYRGKIVNKNIDESLRLIRQSANMGNSKAKQSLIKILFELNEEDHYVELFELCQKESETNNYYAMMILGKLYYYGYGTSVDCDKAINIISESAKGNSRYADDLMDLLIEINTPDSIQQMLAVAHEYADKDNAGAYGRLGRAYRDGIGVEKNLNTAAKWFEKAASKSPWWQNEYNQVIKTLQRLK